MDCSGCWSATLSARWTYTSGDVTFGLYRQGVRTAILETFAWHASQSVQHALYAIADVVLATYDEIADVTLSFHERAVSSRRSVRDRHARESRRSVRRGRRTAGRCRSDGRADVST